ncbi:hypothetical protein V1515DRAFT_601337 [Lipomyces mesembrius]
MVSPKLKPLFCVLWLQIPYLTSQGTEFRREGRTFPNVGEKYISTCSLRAFILFSTIPRVGVSSNIVDRWTKSCDDRCFDCAKLP